MLISAPARRRVVPSRQFSATVSNVQRGKRSANAARKNARPSAAMTIRCRECSDQKCSPHAVAGLVPVSAPALVLYSPRDVKVRWSKSYGWLWCSWSCVCCCLVSAPCASAPAHKHASAWSSVSCCSQGSAAQCIQQDPGTLCRGVVRGGYSRARFNYIVTADRDKLVCANYTIRLYGFTSTLPARLVSQRLIKLART